MSPGRTAARQTGRQRAPFPPEGGHGEKRPGAERASARHRFAKTSILLRGAQSLSNNTSPATTSATPARTPAAGQPWPSAPSHRITQAGVR